MHLKRERIIFRVDAATSIGIGHVMRCLTLAENLKKYNNTIQFICRKAQGDCIELIRDRGFFVTELPEIDEEIWTYTDREWAVDAHQTIQAINNQSVSVLIVDHYAIDERWEERLYSFTDKMMVIDDIANRKHVCDILLDQNDYIKGAERYYSLTPSNCKKLLGASYCLLRDEFIEQRINLKQRNSSVHNIFVSFGGSDPTDETTKLLQALLKFKDKQIHVVVGKGNVNSEAIKNFCKKYSNYYYYFQINNMAEIINKCDIAIGAGGSSTWERCSLGIPSLVVATAPNQLELSRDAAKKEVIKFLGLASEITIMDWQMHIHKFIQNEKLRHKIAENSLELVDGLGIKRIVREILI